ncbi:MAG: D-alanine--D-alanine ligase [Chromatiales bacterium]|jgi:D-alanine-D-alanine ligase|nr:D-alanine--D-alanine ligase [Chromatiales bacterium]
MTQTKRRLAVLFGGRSAEHEVSVNSARSVLEYVDRQRYEVTLIGIDKQGIWRVLDGFSNSIASGEMESDSAPTVLVDHGNGQSLVVQHHDGRRERLPIDVVFPVLHGPHGEDGTVQGLLELAGLPTVGSGVAGSAVAMDKELAKRVFKAEGLAQLDYMVVRRQRWRERADIVLIEIEGRLGLPVFAKPARLGSSVGVSRADDRESLRAAIDEAARYDNKIIVEAAALGCREVECSVLGYETPEASIPGEIVPCNDFYDYEAKYLAENSELLIPAPLSEAATAQIQALAVAAFRAVGANGLARVDFFVCGDDESIFLNEINTMPGFTPTSMYPKLWAASGLEYGALIDRLIELALERHDEHQQNETSWE